MAERPASSASAWNGLRLPFGKRLNARRPGPVTALDVDEQMVRVAQSVPRGNRTAVTRVLLAPLNLSSEGAVSDPTALGEAVARALETLRFKPSQVVMGVPRQLVVLRTLTLPIIDDVRELASMVHMQIGKDLPFRQEDAIIDFKVRMETGPAPGGAAELSKSSAGADPGPRAEVLVAAVRRETVEFYQQVAAAAKVKLIALGWLSQANARCVEACQVVPPNDVAALVSIRSNEVGIDVVAQGCLLYSRGASIKPVPDSSTAGEEASDAEPSAPAPALPPEKYVQAVVIEVVRSLHAYSGMEANAPVKKLLVAGGTGQEAAVVEGLQQRLNLACTRLDPAEAMDLPKAARERAADALGAIGLGLGVNDPEGLPFDFLNPKRPAVQRNTKRIRTLALVAAGVVVLMGILGIRGQLIKRRMKINTAVKLELAQAETKLPIYRKMRQQATTLQNWTRDGRNWLEQYGYLSAVLPPSEDLYITSLSVSGQGNIHLAVQARSGEILANLDRQLRAAGYDVKPLAITPGNDKFGYNFRSTVELIIPAKMKIDLTKVQPPARPADDGSLDPKGRPGRKGGRS